LDDVKRLPMAEKRGERVGIDRKVNRGKKGATFDSKVGINYLEKLKKKAT